MQLVDLDHDGRDEVIIGKRYWLANGAVEIWKYNPSTNTLESSNSLPLSGEPHDLAVADFDNDNLHEIVASGRFGWGPQYIDQTSPGVWSPPVQLPQYYTWQLLVDDFDKDRNLDFFQAIDSGIPGRLFYGDGHGNFSMGPSLPWGYQPGRGYTVIDADADGFSNLVAMQDIADKSALVLYRNNGDRTWSDPQIKAQEFGAADKFGSPAAGDFDRDGYVDTVTLLFHQSTLTTSLVKFKGGPALTWSAQTVEELPGQWAASVVADVNNDGNKDIVVTAMNRNQDLLLYLGDGAGSFSKQVIDLDHGVGGLNVQSVGDINGDGRPDIVAARSTVPGPEYYFWDGFEVFFNTTSANHPPVANAGPDQTLECSSRTQTPVTLDGSGSTDPDNDPLSFLWSNSFGTATGSPVNVGLPLGTHNVSLQVTDSHGATSTDQVMINIRDTQPPAATHLTASPQVMWPPNHAMLPVSLNAVAADVCSPTTRRRITGVTSNEPVLGTGSGDIGPDWEVTGQLSVNLRSERSGSGRGRVYTVTVECSDATGNRATKQVAVTVPKSM